MAFENPQLQVSELAQLSDIKFEKLHPYFLRMRVLGTLILFAIIALGWIASALIVGRSGLALFFLLIIPVAAATVQLHRIDFRRRGYALREHDFTFRRGVLFQQVATVPFARIQNIKIERGPLDRSFGLATLRIRSAGGRIDVSGLPHEDATQLRAFVAGRAGLLADNEVNQTTEGYSTEPSSISDRSQQVEHLEVDE